MVNEAFFVEPNKKWRLEFLQIKSRIRDILVSLNSRRPPLLLSIQTVRKRKLPNTLIIASFVTRKEEVFLRRFSFFSLFDYFLFFQFSLIALRLTFDPAFALVSVVCGAILVVDDNPWLK